MSVWISSLRGAPTGGPGQKRARKWRGRRRRCPSRWVPARCRHVGVRISGACGRGARWNSRCSEPGEGRSRCSLRPPSKPTPDIGISFARRSSRFSRSITDACGLTRDHPGIELRSRPPLDPLRSDSAPTSRVLATGEISPASFPVSAAGWPTRRTVSRSLWRCRSGGVSR